MHPACEKHYREIKKAASKQKFYYLDVPNPDDLEGDWIPIVSTRDWDTAVEALRKMEAGGGGTLRLLSICVVDSVLDY